MILGATEQMIAFWHSRFSKNPYELFDILASIEPYTVTSDDFVRKSNALMTEFIKYSDHIQFYLWKKKMR